MFPAGDAEFPLPEVVAVLPFPEADAVSAPSAEVPVSADPTVFSVPEPSAEPAVPGSCVFSAVAGPDASALFSALAYTGIASDPRINREDNATAALFLTVSAALLIFFII
jgi:hypothetical protein